MLRQKCRNSGTRTHDESSAELEQSTTHLRPEPSNQDSEHDCFSSEDSLYVSELLGLDDWNVAVASPTEHQEDHIITLSFVCVYCFSSNLFQRSCPWRQFRPQDLWHSMYPVSDDLGASVLYSTRQKWRRHVKTAHSTSCVGNHLTTTTTMRGAFGSVNPMPARCVFCKADIDVVRRYEHHLAKHLQEIALQSLRRAQSASDVFIEHRNVREHLVYPSLRWTSVLDRLYGTALMGNLPLLSACTSQPTSAPSLEWMWNENNPDTGSKQAKMFVGAQFGMDASCNTENDHERNSDGAINFSNYSHVLARDARHDVSPLLKRESTSIASKQHPESIRRLRSQHVAHSQANNNDFDSEQIPVDDDRTPLTNVQHPRVNVSDDFGQITTWRIDDNDAFLLNDEPSTTARLVELVGDRVCALNLEWLRRLSSTQDLYVHCSAPLAPSLLENGIRTIQRCFHGTLPSRLEDVFALIHVAFALSSVVQTDADSQYWDAFCSNVLEWQYALSNATEVLLWTRIWNKLWRPRAYRQIVPSAGHLNNSPLL